MEKRRHGRREREESMTFGGPALAIIFKSFKHQISHTEHLEALHWPGSAIQQTGAYTVVNVGGAE